MVLGLWLHKLLGFPSVSAIQIASFHPGDLLLVQFPEDANTVSAQHIRELQKDRLPSAVNCCVTISASRLFASSTPLTVRFNGRSVPREGRCFRSSKPVKCAKAYR